MINLNFEVQFDILKPFHKFFTSIYGLNSYYVAMNQSISLIYNEKTYRRKSKNLNKRNRINIYTLFYRN